MVLGTGAAERKRRVGVWLLLGRTVRRVGTLEPHTIRLPTGGTKGTHAEKHGVIPQLVETLEQIVGEVVGSFSEAREKTTTERPVVLRAQMLLSKSAMFGPSTTVGFLRHVHDFRASGGSSPYTLS